VQNPSLAAVVPAAGRSSRFGGVKLLAPVDGEPLLNRTLASLLDVGVDPLALVLAPGAAFETVPLVSHANVRVLINRDPSRGMFSSIQAGLAVAGGDVILVLPADMPFVATSTITSLVQACLTEDRVVVPLFQDRRGHPVAIPGRIREGLLMMPPDRSLKDALISLGEEPTPTETSDPGVVRDVDVPEDLRPAT
jgi:molybdenum cofactor cytidylyltransferase